MSAAKAPVADLPSANSSKSFWHSEPSEFLRGHRTTPDLPETADVAIVGTGITGTSAAKFLTGEEAHGRQLRVVVLDAREACWGATGRNGGHCQPLLLTQSPDIGAFELRNYNYVQSYIKTNEIPCEWRGTTSCRTFWTPALWKAAQESVKELKEASPELGKLVRVTTNEDELRKCGVPDAPGAILTTGAASVWPYKYVSWILEELIRTGKINLQTNTAVTDISPLPDTASANAQTYRYRLRTPRGDLRARHVVLATNGYTSRLLRRFADLIVPVRGEMSALLPPPGSTRLPNTHGFVGARGQKPNHDDYLVQRPFEGVPNPAGHLMFGGGGDFGTLPTVGESDDSIVDEGIAAYLRESLLKLMDLPGDTQGLEKLYATHIWTGIMGWSRDDHPWVGPVPDAPGLWISAGYTGHGMPNATLCARAVASMIVGEEEGERVEDVGERLVSQEELPRGYLVSKERIRKARELLSVAVADELGFRSVYANRFFGRAQEDSKL